MCAHSYTPPVAGAPAKRAVIPALIVFGSLAACAVRAEEPAAPIAETAPADPEALKLFETAVRPLLVEHCQKCHNTEDYRGKLLLDSRAHALEGGESGDPAIVPGKPEESLLVQAINYESLEMPPDGKLDERSIAAFTRWVKLGAPWPGDTTPSGTSPRKAGYEVTDEDRQFWSFQPVARPAIPATDRPDWVANLIDAFILARLQDAQLSPAPPAGKRELIRRAYFDLIGLPPAPEEVAAFAADDSPDAYEKLIDRLLAMPQYGERWGRHWLDVVRYAQSNGYERDGDKPQSWRYRDYVIDAVNADKPFDRFLVEQLAGDELEPATDETLTATGYYRLGVWDDEPDDERQAEFDALDDVLATTGTAMLGLTIGCARCHDHKFDPIPQEDYYSLLSFIRNVKGFSKDQSTLLKDDAALLADLPSGGGQTLAVKENGANAPETRVLARGDSGTPGKLVEPRFPQVLCRSAGDVRLRLPENSPEESAGRQTSGRRRALAEWIASGENPLTARVIVNRLWHHHFGKGIVSTPSDFGHTGQPPSHPELLDWLATELIDGGWRLKRLHKLILMSSTYRQSSRAVNPQAAAVDPDNALLWRQNLRRLDAEAIRDSILAVDGRLDLSRGGPSFYPRLPSEVLASESRPGLGWARPDESQQARRSVYIFAKRTLQVPLLEQFDMPSPDKPTPARARTTVAPQALTLLNGDFLRDAAAAFAERLLKEAPSDPRAQVERAYDLALARRPTDQELKISLDFIERRRRALAAEKPRMAFYPEVPGALTTTYLNQLLPSDFMSGPKGWEFYRGVWDNKGELIYWVNPHRGPFALWPGVTLENGTIDAALVLPANTDFGSMIFRAQARSQALVGYELLLDPREQSISLVRHEDDAVVLASAKASVPVDRVIHVNIKLAGDHFRVFLEGASQPLFEATDPHPLAAGQLGVRTWGAGLEVEELTIHAGDKSVVVGRIERGSLASATSTESHEPSAEEIARRKALAAWCLLILNLNEFVYVD